MNKNQILDRFCDENDEVIANQYKPFDFENRKRILKRTCEVCMRAFRIRKKKESICGPCKIAGQGLIGRF